MVLFFRKMKLRCYTLNPQSQRQRVQRLWCDTKINLQGIWQLYYAQYIYLIQIIRNKYRWRAYVYSSFCVLSFILLSRNMTIKRDKIKILPLNIFLCGTFSVTLKEEQRMRPSGRGCWKKGRFEEGKISKKLEKIA